MPKASPSGDRGTLEQLCGEEAELERSLLEARREAASVIAVARGEAEQIAAEARAALEAELSRVRASVESDVTKEASAARAAAEAEVVALARRAERNRSRALARLVEVVLHGGGS
jgi:F0F1-type ATP synthase membrane subunit b/b'